MNVRIAYIEEPPFYWTGNDGRPTGADIEVAEVVFRAIGASFEYVATTFGELLPGLQEGRWDVNVPIFITSERAQHVVFSVPVWKLGDGFLVRRGNPKALTSYRSIAARPDARLGAIPGQIQHDAAKSAGVTDGQTVMFKNQPEAIAALLAGTIDAFASTAIGSRTLAESHVTLEAVSLAGNAPVGGFSFNKDNTDLLRAVNEQLRRYLGSVDHRARMAKYGFGASELDSIVV